MCVRTCKLDLTRILQNPLTEIVRADILILFVVLGEGVQSFHQHLWFWLWVFHGNFISENQGVPFQPAIVLATLACHIRMLVGVPDALLLSQFPGDMPEKPVLGPLAPVGDQDGVPRFSLAQPAVWPHGECTIT